MIDLRLPRLLGGRVKPNEWWSALLVLAMIAASILLGAYIPKYSQGYRVLLLLGLVLLIGLKWKTVGFIYFMAALAPFEWPEFTFSRIPIIGWLPLPDVSLREKVILTFGGIFVIWLLFRSFEKGKRLHLMPFVPLAIVLVFGALVALFLAWFPGEQEFLGYSHTFLAGSIIFLMVHLLVRTPRQGQVVAACLVISGVLFSLAVITPWGVETATRLNIDPSQFGGSWDFPFGIRVETTNHVYLSAYMAFSIVLAWGMLLTAPTTWRRGILLAIIVLLAIPLLRTLGRTGVYGGVTSMIVVTAIYLLFPPREGTGLSHYSKWPHPQRKGIANGMTRVFSIVILVGVASLVSYSVASLVVRDFSDPALAIERLTTPFSTRFDTIEHRRYLIETALNLSLHSPLGIGILAMPSVTGYNDHTIYTEMLASLGWIGFVAVAWLVVWCIRNCIHLIRSNDPAKRSLALTLTGGFVTVLVAGVTSPFVGPVWGTWLFWILLGLAAAVSKFHSVSD